MSLTVNNTLWGFATAWLDYDSLEATIELPTAVNQ